MDRITRKLIAIEIKLGFLYIPAKNIDMMPAEKSQITCILDTPTDLSYNPEYHRIFGLKSWFALHEAKAGDIVVITKNNDDYIFEFNSSSIAKQIDVSNLNSRVKGDIIEDRIKELVVLQGQGILNTYKPSVDVAGVDLIVVKNGEFHPLFLQIKGRYKLQGNSLILSVKLKGFVPHPNFFIVGAYFNPEKSELAENILLIPSKDVANNAYKAITKQGEVYRITASLNDKQDNKWSEHIIKKSELATKLFGLFESATQ